MTCWLGSFGSPPGQQFYACACKLRRCNRLSRASPTARSIAPLAPSAAGYKMLRASGLTVSRRAFAGAGSSRALLKAQRCRSAGLPRARAARFVTQDILVLVPTGDGSVDHLDEGVELPGMLELKEGTNTLGRSAPAELIIGVPTVSAKHAEIKVEGKRVLVTDLNSTNGTFIEEEEIEAMVPNDLHLGAEVIFGDTFLAKFCLEER